MFVSEGSESVKTATLSFMLNYEGKRIGSGITQVYVETETAQYVWRCARARVWRPHPGPPVSDSSARVLHEIAGAAGTECEYFLFPINHARATIAGSPAQPRALLCLQCQAPTRNRSSWAGRTLSLLAMCMYFRLFSKSFGATNVLKHRYAHNTYPFHLKSWLCLSSISSIRFIG